MQSNHSSSGYSKWSEAARERWEDFWSSRGAIEKVLLVLEDNRDCIPWGSAEDFMRPDARVPRRLALRRTRKTRRTTAPVTEGSLADSAPRAELATAALPDTRRPHR